MPAPTDELVQVFDAVGRLVADVRADQWSLPTPCPEWNVRELVNHMVLGNRLFAGILTGTAAVTPDALDPTAADALGDDPAGAYRDAAEGLLAAFRQPGVLERMFVVPAGEVPGVACARLRVVEDLVHGLDLARATGQRPRLPDAVAERAIAFTAGTLPDIPPERSPFGPPQPAPGDAPAAVRLAALLGRSPDQVPT